jgi:hypothetical protein
MNECGRLSGGATALILGQLAVLFPIGCVLVAAQGLGVVVLAITIAVAYNLAKVGRWKGICDAWLPHAIVRFITPY